MVVVELVVVGDGGSGLQPWVVVVVGNGVSGGGCDE